MCFARQFPRRAKRKAAAPAECSSRSPAASSTDTAPCGPTDTEHVRGIGADRARRAIRQIDHQQQHAVPSLKRPRRQQAPEQRMRLRDHPHLARQHRTQLLQSVAFTVRASARPTWRSSIGHRVSPARRRRPVRQPPPNGSPVWPSASRRSHPSATHARLRPLPCAHRRRLPMRGYIPFDPKPPTVLPTGLRPRYERAKPLIVTSNRAFEGLERAVPQPRRRRSP